MKPFFPDATFGWIYVGSVLTLLAVAAYYDTTTTRIPKFVTLPMLALGVLFQPVRGYLLAEAGHRVFFFEVGSPIMGALDGLLFGLCGFLLAFVIYFGIWILGICGGGDVKLFAAIGPWVGPMLFPWLMLLTVIVQFFWLAGRLLTGGVSPSAVNKNIAKLKPGAKSAGKQPLTRTTFSLPAGIATAIVLLWAHGVELEISPPPPPKGAADVGCGNA